MEAQKTPIPQKVTDLEGLGKCRIEEWVEGRPELVEIDRIEKPKFGYNVIIYRDKDFVKYWQVKGYYTDEYDQLYKVLEELPE